MINGTLGNNTDPRYNYQQLKTPLLWSKDSNHSIYFVTSTKNKQFGLMEYVLSEGQPCMEPSEHPLPSGGK